MDPLTVASLRRHLQARVDEALVAAGVETSIPLAPPPKAEMGDLGFPCFALAKVLRKAPPLIAKDIAGGLSTDHVIAEDVVILRPSAVSATVVVAGGARAWCSRTRPARAGYVGSKLTRSTGSMYLRERGPQLHPRRGWNEWYSRTRNGFVWFARISRSSIVAAMNASPAWRRCDLGMTFIASGLSACASM